jgi:hypothetical protein
MDGGTPTLMSPLERANLSQQTLALSKGPNRVGIFRPPEDVNRSSSKTLCLLISRIPDYEQSPKTQ